MKKTWKKLLAAGCALSMVMSVTGTSVLAEELQENMAVSATEDLEQELKTVEFPDEREVAEDVLVDENIDIDEKANNREADEETVGRREYTVGDGVKATFDEKTGAVELYSNGGTLWNDWQEKSGLTKKTIKSLKVVSGPILLPADSSRIFSVKHYNHYHDDGNDYDWYDYPLEELSLSGFDTSNVTNMAEMFNDCDSLIELDVSGIDTSKVQNMSGMFAGCRKISLLDLSGFVTSSVTDMSGMFSACGSLAQLNLSKFDTSNVTSMASMFMYCGKLNNLNLNSFDTSNVISMCNMFLGCSEITELNLNNFKTTRVTDMRSMFSSCSKLKKLQIDKLDTSNLTELKSMFEGCESLEKLDLSSFDTSNVKIMYQMFYGCNALTELNLSSFNTSKVENMVRMFLGCKNLKRLDLGTFDTSAVIYMDAMFSGCSNLEMLDLGNFNTSNLWSMSYLFSECNHLAYLDLSGFDMSGVGYVNDAIFDGCEDLSVLITPKNNGLTIKLNSVMYDEFGNEYTELPKMSKSIVLTKDNPLERADIADCIITLDSDKFTYDGKAKEPTVTVKNGDMVLTSGTDYTVSYSDNTNAGTATVMVTGKGNYKGEKSVTFTINKADAKLTFAESAVTKKTTDDAFTNALTKTTDGTVTFKSSDTNVATVDSASGLVTIKGIGTTTVIAEASEGKNYKAGSAVYTLTVEDGRVDISGLTVTLSTTSYTYNGKAKKPNVTVKNGDVVLISGTDYTVSYADNTNAGTATVTVTGKGNYNGEKSITFTINKVDAKLSFTESAVTKKTTDTAFTNALTKTTDGTVTFTTSDQKVAEVDSDSGLVTIKGIGTTTITASATEGRNYKAGCAEYTLTVEDGRIDISGLTATLSVTSYTYDGKAKQPTVTVKNGDAVLTSGTDYTVSYVDNTNAGTATVKLTGTGNYKGEKSVKFTINKADAKLTFAESTITKKTTDSAFTNTLTKTTDGAVTFKSGDTKVATVDSTSGLVTIKGAGTTTITATASEGQNYKAGSAAYTLTIEAPASTPTPTPAASGFSDVQDPKHAYYKAIYWAAEEGITKGYPDGTFGINKSCTRGEMIMFLWRYAGKPAPKAVSKSPFKDVAKSHAFYKAILWASQKGITKGYPDGTFGIDRNVSRAECMMFLWRVKGKPAPKAVAKSPFKDVATTNAFYKAILWGYQNKITTGYTSGAKKGTFGINENCTRGQIVTFLFRAK